MAKPAPPCPHLLKNCSKPDKEIKTMSILLQNVSFDHQLTDILIDGNHFAKISPLQQPQPDWQIVDCTGKAILPAFYNNHSHAGMSLFRGISDDKNLFDWLNNDIWPREAKLTPEMIYTGTKFSILEMIKTGTVFFADMYFAPEMILKAVAETGIRAAVSLSTCDLFDAKRREAEQAKIEEYMALPNPAPELISKVLTIHAVYTASAGLIKFNVETAAKHNLRLHIHACETLKEVKDCYAEHGCSPIKYLDKLGALTNKTILAHSVFLDEEDIDLLAQKGVWLCSNPSSNYKLASGVFMLQKLLNRGCHITLGTDSMASNNNLSMLDEMKLCALSAKIQSNDPTAGSAADVFKIATRNGALAFGLDAGETAEGKLADCILVDLDNHFLVPDYNLISNMVYSADSSCIDSVICNGKILMSNRKVAKEKDLIQQVRKLSDFFRD